MWWLAAGGAQILGADLGRSANEVLAAFDVWLHAAAEVVGVVLAGFGLWWVGLVAVAVAVTVAAVAVTVPVPVGLARKLAGQLLGFGLAREEA